MKSKAYVCSDICCYNRMYIVFANNPKEAKIMLARVKGCETVDFDIRREARLDKYCNKPIPARILIRTGWFGICPKCCNNVYIDGKSTAIYKGSKAFCGYCGEELVVSEDIVLRKIPPLLKRRNNGDGVELFKQVLNDMGIPLQEGKGWITINGIPAAQYIEEHDIFSSPEDVQL